MTPAIKTERLRLYAPYHRTFDIERQVDWLNDKQVVKYSEQRHHQHTWDTQWKYLCSFDHVSSHIWEISHDYAGRHGRYDYPIGTITVYRDLVNKAADIGLMIGNREVWGSGYGCEAWEAVMGFLFADNVQKIEAGTVSGNDAMLKIMLKSGMVPEGIRRNRIIIDGTPRDVLLMGKIK